MMGNNNPIIQFAQSMIQNNMDKIQNTPFAQAGIAAIMNADENAGAQLANNLCQSHGVSKEQGFLSALNWFKANK